MGVGGWRKKKKACDQLLVKKRLEATVRTLKGSDGPKGSNADRSDGFPLNMAPEDANESMGTEKAANGSALLAEELAKGSGRCLSSLPPSSPPSSR